MSSEIATEQQEKRALVQRIADSPAFRGAPRLRDFLLFVTERALAGHTDEISEQSIGHQVFHRPENYDTANDNIVRVSARQLRVKLKEYSDGEGAAEPWHLEVPKGAYVPVFTRRMHAEPDTPAAAISAAVAAPAPASARFWKFATLACALLAAALGIALLRSRAASPSAAARAPAPLTDLVIRPGQRTLMVLADSSLVLLHELTGAMVGTEDYAAGKYPHDFGEVAGLPRAVPVPQLTSVADVGFAIRLLRLRPDAADRLMVVHARDVGPRNLKEDNVILSGGPRSNPWTGLFEDRMNFRFEFTDAKPQARIVNTKPQSGEAPIYVTERNGSTARAYARLALLPNLDNTGRVLLISGTTIEATEAAIEFFLDARSEQTLTGVLGRKPGTGHGFEVLFETRAIGGTARNSRIVAHRALP